MSKGINLLKEFKYRAYEIFGTMRLEEIWDILHVATDRISKDPVKGILISILNNYAKDKIVKVDRKEIASPILLDSIRQDTYTAEEFRNEVNQCIHEVLLAHIDELEEKIKEKVPAIKIVPKKKVSVKAEIPEDATTKKIKVNRPTVKKPIPTRNIRKHSILLDEEI